MDIIQARIQASFGHRRSFRHPAMAIHLTPFQGHPLDIIHPNDTQQSLDRATMHVRRLRTQGAQLLWVGERNTHSLLQPIHHRTNEPIIGYRWPAGLLTNFNQVSQSPRGRLPGLLRQPDAIIVLSAHAATLALKEARACRILTIGVIDSNMDPGRVDIPIFGNDDSHWALTYYLSQLNR